MHQSFGYLWARMLYKPLRAVVSDGAQINELTKTFKC